MQRNTLFGSGPESATYHFASCRVHLCPETTKGLLLIHNGTLQSRLHVSLTTRVGAGDVGKYRTAELVHKNEIEALIALTDAKVLVHTDEHPPRVPREQKEAFSKLHGRRARGSAPRNHEARRHDVVLVKVVQSRQGGKNC